MTRKIIFTSAAAIIVAAVASSSADARGFGGGGFHGLAGGRPGGMGTVHLNPGFGAHHSQIVSLPGGGHQPPGGGHQPPGGGHRPPGGDHHPPGGFPHHHGHWVFQDGSWIYIDEPVDVTPAAMPGPCTCLTKTYTPSGLVVFADICTKESASAAATDDFADASTAPSTAVPAMDTPISEVPTVPNYAGRTYQDYLAANPQLARPLTSTQTPEQSHPEK
jgi:hypothetical protein